MKKLLVLSLAAALLGGSSALAWGPCSPPCLVLPLKREVVSGYRTETRTEIRLVPKKVCRTVADTKTEIIEEKVLVPYYRDEERTKEVMTPKQTEEERPCKALIPGCEDEKQEKTLMVPFRDQEKKTRIVCDMQTVPELKRTCVLGCTQVPLVVGDLSCGPISCLCPQFTLYQLGSQIVHHLVPVPRDVAYECNFENFKTKTQTCTIQVPTFKDAKPVKVPLCEYVPKTQTCKVKVLDFREETRTHKVPVTTYRTIEETVMVEQPCTVEVRVPCQKEVWVPVCPGK